MVDGGAYQNRISFSIIQFKWNGNKPMKSIYYFEFCLIYLKEISVLKYLNVKTKAIMQTCQAEHGFPALWNGGISAAEMFWKPGLL